MKHKNFLIQVALIVFFFALALLISRRPDRGEYISFMGFTQGTTYQITYQSKKGQHFQTEIDSILAEFDSSLSIYVPQSIISRINRNDPGAIPDKWFTDIFNKSLEVNQKTGGAFDITVGPIVNALGFGSGDTLDVDSAMIDSLRNYVGMDKLKLENGRIAKSDPHVVIDVNAIAQGFSVDVVADFLESKGIKNYMVEIGGEVRARGKNQRGIYWQIGIDRPEEGNFLPGADLQAIVGLKNKSLATSGNYRKFYVRKGIKYVHTINPATGFPAISNLLSATVVAKDCATADAYATSFMVFGVDKSIEFLKKNDFLDAYLIYSDNQGNYRIYITPGLKRFIEE